MAQERWRLGAMVIAIGWVTMGLAGTARAWQEAEVNEQEGAQTLTQGPIHEAFAEPVLFDPKPGPVVPKSPPRPIQELPPEQKPEGDNVQWIPGYWAWDDTRNDFLWVSGLWRAIPPGRQWIPGYWEEVERGSQWVPGYWSAPEATQVEYLPEPPASIEKGPSSQPPTPDATWAPGMWVWQSDQYVWRPGFWVNNQPGWMWSPASYSWTPNGYVYNQGYWDYPLVNRGTAFAPTYFSQPIYNQPNYQFTPTVGLMNSALYSSLFVRPAYSSYYFGDYYAPNNFQSGIYPWYAFHGSRYGYDPLYAYAAAQNVGTNPRWADELHDTYRFRREHPEARPPKTFAETRRLAARPTGAGGANAATAAASNMVLARPLHQLGAPATGAAANANARASAPRFERIDAARRQELAQQAAQVHQFGEDRRRRESDARRANPAAERPAPRPVASPRSPIIAAPPAQAQGRNFTPPAAPQHPAFDRAVQPAVTGAPPIRHEPQPEFRPPAPRPGPAPAPAAAPARPAPGPAPAPAAAPARPAPGPAPAPAAAPARPAPGPAPAPAAAPARPAPGPRPR